MPARPALAPGTVPGRLAWLRCLPQREVERLALLLARLHPLARAQIVEVSPRELRVRRILGDGEVDVALRFVGNPAGDQLLDQRDDLRKVIGHLRRDVGLEQAERDCVLTKLLDEPRGEADRVFTAL